jgi:hypothetical protein
MVPKPHRYHCHPATATHTKMSAAASIPHTGTSTIVGIEPTARLANFVISIAIWMRLNIKITMQNRIKVRPINT